MRRSRNLVFIGVILSLIGVPAQAAETVLCESDDGSVWILPAVESDVRPDVRVTFGMGKTCTARPDTWSATHPKSRSSASFFIALRSNDCEFYMKGWLASLYTQDTYSITVGGGAAAEEANFECTVGRHEDGESVYRLLTGDRLPDYPPYP